MTESEISEIVEVGREHPKVVRKLYKNYKGFTTLRTFVPVSVRFDEKNEWHGENVWILHAFDLDKKEYRDFCLSDFF